MREHKPIPEAYISRNDMLKEVLVDILQLKIFQKRKHRFSKTDLNCLSHGQLKWIWRNMWVALARIKEEIAVKKHTAEARRAAEGHIVRIQDPKAAATREAVQRQLEERRAELEEARRKAEEEAGSRESELVDEPNDEKSKELDEEQLSFWDDS